MNSLLIALFTLVALSIFPPPASAQDDSTRTDALAPITVFGDLEKDSTFDLLPTVDQITGPKLERRRQATVGETLSREAGVNSSFFGPNSSRPVIRGLEGERVRILQNGIGSLDASGTSPDHAIALDPLLIDRFEIIRGPSALLYGSSAIGGVVNVVSSRIPERLERDVLFTLNSRASSVDAGRAGGAVLKPRLGRWAFHLDGLARASEDYRVPEGKVVNSASNAYDGAIGGSHVFESGFFGTSLQLFGTRYGTVAEPEVEIDLDRERLDWSGELRSESWIQSARFRGAFSHYKHLELDEGEVATTFQNRGIENRVDLKHGKLGPFNGILGAQLQHFRLSAEGDEAFIPTTTNTSLAIFAYEEVKLGAFTPSFGARIDRSQVRADESAILGAGDFRQYWIPSASLGVLYALDEAYSLGLNVSYTERAPNYQELFSNGPHLATGIFEIGNRDIARERGASAEFSLRHKSRMNESRATLFLTEFQNFLALSPTGAVDPGSSLDVFEYSAIEARLYGFEIEFGQQLPWKLGSGAFRVELVVDMTRGMDRSGGGQLPRMPPLRETLSLIYLASGWEAEVQAQRSERQTMVAENEDPTDAFTQLNLGFAMPIETSMGSFRAIARANNLLDAEVRNHVSFVKEIAPQPGRNFVLGFQAFL